MLEWVEKLSGGECLKAASVYMPFKNLEYGVDKRVEW